MKFKSFFVIKIMFIIVTAFMLMLPLPSVLFADSLNNDNKSLTDVIELKGDTEVDVIVEFSSPSLLELNFNVDDTYAINYERKLLEEQKAILDKIDVVPQFNYTKVINGAAVSINRDEIRLLEQMSGVKGIYLSQTYKAQELSEYDENSISSANMMGISSDVSNGYTGDGVLVAVLDSGITFNHEAFNNTKYVVNPALTSTDVINLGFSAPAGYYNEKIPFYCDYTGATSDFTDADGHGSHVAGIIAGYAENEDGTVKFSGIAPGAQICAMRVLNEFGGGNDAMIVAALEDAYKLGVDIINISFGRDSSFRLGGAASLEYDGIYERLEEAGVVVVCSAGNLGSMAENTPRYVLDENCVDYGTLSLPAIYPGNIGVGSINNNQQYTAVANINGVNYRYSDPQDSNSELNFKNALSGKTVDVLYFNNYGMEEDYVGVDVSGKIIAVNRGGLSFTDKCKYATNAGAIGLIVINGPSDAMGNMVINNQTIPALLVENAAVEQFPKEDCVIEIGYGMIFVEGGGELSYFSAVGVTPDLEIGLDILGIGSKVTSVKSNTINEYITYSGTSMASPTIAGTYALLYQMLKESDEFKDKSRFDTTSYMEDVTQSTATLIMDELGNIYSPRFQGSGYINFNKAATADAYITNPLICLGDDKNSTASISMEYELVNCSDIDKHYLVNVCAIIDSFRQISPINYKNNVSPQMLDISAYTYTLYVDDVLVSSYEAITLPANGTATVKVELSLSENYASRLAAAFPYGYFLDGYVEFYDVNDLSESAMHGGFVSFVGDWLAGPAIEPLTQAEVMDWIDSIGATIEELLPYFAAGHIDANYSYNKLLVGENQNYIGQNPLNDGGYITSFEDRNAISASFTNADKVLYDSLTLYPSLLRSCKSLRYVVSNSETGEIYASKVQNYVIKDIPIGTYEHFNFTDFTFDAIYTAPNELGEITEHHIPSGTEVTLSIYALLDHPDAVERLETQYTLTIDYTGPEVYYDYDAATKMLTIKCYDSEYLAGIVLEAVDGSYNVGEKVDSRIYADYTPGVEHVEVFDLSSYEGESISITVSDYASNMETLVLSLVDGNISNIESSISYDNGLNVEFIDTPYIYQDVMFKVSPETDYCFSESFEILVNAEKLTPTVVENGVYYYNITVLEEALVITSNGVATHTYVETITKEPTCKNTGLVVKACSNCGHIHSTTTLDTVEHNPGEYVTTQEATSVDSGLSVSKCTECDCVMDVQIIPATGGGTTCKVSSSIKYILSLSAALSLLVIAVRKRK